VAGALSEHRALSDRELYLLAERLEHQIAALRTPTTRAAAILAQEYRDRLDRIRAEQDRRWRI
jgi:hypothetical protein